MKRRKRSVPVEEKDGETIPYYCGYRLRVRRSQTEMRSGGNERVPGKPLELERTVKTLLYFIK